RHVLDHLRTEHAWEGLVGEREGKAGRADAGDGEPTRKPQLGDPDVERNAPPRQGANDVARPASDVEHRVLPFDQLENVTIAAPLPVALQRDGAVVRAVIIV